MPPPGDQGGGWAGDFCFGGLPLLRLANRLKAGPTALLFFRVTGCDEAILD